MAILPNLLQTPPIRDPNPPHVPKFKRGYQTRRLSCHSQPPLPRRPQRPSLKSLAMLLLLLLLLILLTACGEPTATFSPKPQNVYPKHLNTGECVPYPPPTVDKFRGRTDPEALVIMGAEWTKQTSVVVKCQNIIHGYESYGDKVQQRAREAAGKPAGSSP